MIIIAYHTFLCGVLFRRALLGDLLLLTPTHLHPLSCSLPNVCELWLPQDKQKNRAFLQFPIEDSHGEWCICTLSFIMYTEEKHGVPSKWNKEALQVGYLIFFFLCQECSRCCIPDLSCSTTFILCFFIMYITLILWWHGERKWELLCEHRGEASAVMTVQPLSYEFSMVVGVCYTYEYMYIRVMGWNIFPMVLMKLYLCIDHTEIVLK